MEKTTRLNVTVPTFCRLEREILRSKTGLPGASDTQGVTRKDKQVAHGPPLGSLGHSGPVSRELSGESMRETGAGGTHGKLKEAVGRTRTQRACRARPRRGDHGVL